MSFLDDRPDYNASHTPPEKIQESKPAETPPPDAKDGLARRDIGRLMIEHKELAKKILLMEGRMGGLERDVQLLKEINATLQALIEAAKGDRPVTQ